ncbi:hypothetical protein Droror1_Dr00006085 [Drosera rotundifolia]
MQNVNSRRAIFPHLETLTRSDSIPSIDFINSIHHHFQFSCSIRLCDGSQQMSPEHPGATRKVVKRPNSDTSFFEMWMMRIGTRNSTLKENNSESMTRKKVKLAYITNDSARKATYKKRKKGFLKKMYELTTLCEIKACAIIYSPYDTQPEVWPSQTEAQVVLSRFKRMPEMEKSKKMVNQEEFLRQRISKAVEQLKKIQKENREKEMTQVMYQCLTGKSLQGLDIVDLNDLGWLIDQNLKSIYKRLENLRKEAVMLPPALPPPQPKVATKQATSERMVVAGTHHDKVPQDQMGGERGGFEFAGMDEGLMQQHSWCMNQMNPHDQMGGFGSGANGGGGGDGEGENKMLMTFADYCSNVNPLWSNAFFQ